MRLPVALRRIAAGTRTGSGWLFAPAGTSRWLCRRTECGKSGVAHLVIIAAPHAFAHRLHVRHVLFRRVVARNRTALRWRGRRNRFPVARQAVRARALALELVLVALHLLLLAVHVPDVVAQKQVQILVSGARQPLLDGLELE